ncbi:unnamed protein product, partial [Rotaria magnacalcarata]
TGHFQRSNQIPQNESYKPHSKATNEQNSLSTPFFLQRPSISSELGKS